MTIPRDLDLRHKIDDALKPELNGLYAWLVVAFSRQEAAKHRHQAHDLIQFGRGLGHFPAIQDVSHLPLILLEQQSRIQMGTCALQSHESGNPTGHHHEQRQSTFQLAFVFNCNAFTRQPFLRTRKNNSKGGRLSRTDRVRYPQARRHLPQAHGRIANSRARLAG